MRVSIIGMGRIGISLENDPLRYKPCTHIGAIQSLIKMGIPLKWSFLCDLDSAKMRLGEDFILSNNIAKEKIRQTQNYHTVVADKPDILIISTDTEMHYDIAISAIKAGIPKIVIEKPLTPTYRKAMQIFKLAKKFDTHIWVNYERRYHSKYRQLKKNIESGENFGNPLLYHGWFASSNSSLFQTNPQNEGVLLHDTTHLVDLALYLFGNVNKSNQTIVGRDAHKLTLLHENGIHGEILTTIDNKFFHFEIEIIFEHARIKMINGFTIVEKLEKSRLYDNFTTLGNPKVLPDKKMQLKNNPFVSLYLSVVKDEYEPSFLKDACQNIKFLT